MRKEIDERRALPVCRVRVCGNALFGWSEESRCEAFRRGSMTDQSISERPKAIVLD